MKARGGGTKRNAFSQTLAMEFGIEVHRGAQVAGCSASTTLGSGSEPRYHDTARRIPNGNNAGGYVRTLLFLFLLLLPIGCSRVPAAPDKPDWTPKESAAAALSQYDTNHDAQISQEEVTKAPGLQAAFKRVDTNQDGQLSEAEIAARIEYYSTANTTIANGATKITLDGRPLAGATVLFEPEDFLGPGFKTSRGETNRSGTANLSGPDAKFPGIYLGMYRVKISKMANGRETLPARYNSATQLGYEVADDTGNVGGIAFDLKSH